MNFCEVRKLSQSPQSPFQGDDLHLRCFDLSLNLADAPVRHLLMTSLRSKRIRNAIAFNELLTIFETGVSQTGCKDTHFFYSAKSFLEIFDISRN